MEAGWVVLDVGKTNAKLTLWNKGGERLARRVRANAVVQAPQYRALDAAGVESWLEEGLREFARLADVRAIVPVAHGAAAALVRGGTLHAPPMDYEDEAPPELRRAYEPQRDPFAATGSPLLPQGLNLGLQLHWLEQLTGPWPDDLQILPWPQYWAWRLSGVAASEASSLGCHSDLWRPREQRPSDLARRRGWAARLPPLRAAGDVLGPISPAWVARTGLPADCQVLCGLHDSNAALHAARGRPELAGRDATVLSTGTWFVAMRTLPPASPDADLPELDERRDCLLNVDVQGRPAPSARFMGGRESEQIAGLDPERLTENYDPEALLARVPELASAGVFVLPSFARGVGPFPDAPGGWVKEPSSPGDKRAVLGLYLALVTDAILELIGSRDRLVVEGRFGEAQVFVQALARLRPQQTIYISDSGDDLCFGALRLLDASLRPRAPLRSVQPIASDLDAYRSAWRARIDCAAACPIA